MTLLRSSSKHVIAALICAVIVGSPAPRPALADSARWEELAAPAPRTGHFSFYDEQHDRMLVLGGVPDDSWILQFGDPPRWSRFVLPGGGPANFVGASTAWDSRRGRIIVVFLAKTRSESPTSAQVWALELDPAPSWSLLTTSGDPPSFRAGESVAYDARRDRLIIFGGADFFRGSYFGPYDSDVWELPLDESSPHPLEWKYISPPGTAPRGRIHASIVIDTIRDRIVIFGGGENPTEGGVVFNDAWALRLDGSSGWLELSPPTYGDPEWRTEHSAIFDPPHNRMLVFGGLDWGVIHGPGTCGDLWELSFGTPSDPESTAVWSPLTEPEQGPGYRYGHTAVLRTASREMVVFAGARSYQYARKNEIWTYSLDAPGQWARSEPTTQPPSERLLASTVYDPRRSRLVAFGGWNGDGFCDLAVGCGIQYFADVWNLNLGDVIRWTRRTPVTSPGPRGGHAAVCDPIRDRMLVFGGSRFNGYGEGYSWLNDVWALDLKDGGDWGQILPSGSPPSPRSGSAALYDPTRDRMLVLGGDSNSQDLWQLSLGEPSAWTQLFPSGSPPPSRVRAAYDSRRDRMLAVDGSRLWELSFAPELSWQELPTTGAPGGFGPVMALLYDPKADRLVAFVGTSSITAWEVDWKAGPAVWRDLGPAGFPPAPAESYSVVYDEGKDRAVLFGLGALPVGLEWYTSHPSGNRTWALQFERSVPILGSVVSAEAIDGHARITWLLSRESAASARIERREGPLDWKRIGEIVPDASGLAVYEDRDVRPGTRYGYRLSFADTYVGEVWLEVPVAPVLRIEGARPNPARELSLAFWLATSAPARIELFDLAGRLALTKLIDNSTPGEHLIRVPEANVLPAGIYVLRLVQESASVTQRVTILP